MFHYNTFKKSSVYLLWYLWLPHIFKQASWGGEGGGQCGLVWPLLSWKLPVSLSSPVEQIFTWKDLKFWDHTLWLSKTIMFLPLRFTALLVDAGFNGERIIVPIHWHFSHLKKTYPGLNVWVPMFEHYSTACSNILKNLTIQKL